MSTWHEEKRVKPKEKINNDNNIIIRPFHKVAPTGLETNTFKRLTSLSIWHEEKRLEPTGKFKRQNPFNDFIKKRVCIYIVGRIGCGFRKQQLQRNVQENIHQEKSRKKYLPEGFSPENNNSAEFVFYHLYYFNYFWKAAWSNPFFFWKRTVIAKWHYYIVDFLPCTRSTNNRHSAGHTKGRNPSRVIASDTVLGVQECGM